jgi:hypothetical protein
VNPVSRTLSVAAGGGGDALAALIVSDALDPQGGPERIVASFSWDRYIIDPTPGPRVASDFEGLVQHAPHIWEVTAHTRLRTGGTSGLAILAQRTKGRFFLLDPSLGAEGVRQQLDELAALVTATAVMLVDVGGDIAGRGHEPELASPLADSLALAAVASLSLPARVVVAGPGLDGELPAEYVRSTMTKAGAATYQLNADDVQAYVTALNRHPSEATALLSAAALGIEGQAEIRDSAALVPIDAGSATLLVADVDQLFAINHVAQDLAESRSFADAEAITHKRCGRTELDHERRKAEMLARDPYAVPSAEDIRERVGAHRIRASQRGATLVSYRRLGEVAGLRTYEPELIRSAVGERSLNSVPLCRV